MAALPDYTLAAWGGVFAVAFVLWFLPQLYFAIFGRSSGPETIQSLRSGEGGTAASPKTEDDEDEPRGGCCKPCCCGCFTRLGSKQRCFGISACCPGYARIVFGCACETGTILFLTYFIVGILILIAVSAAGSLTLYANVAASACQAKACTASDPAACCSYTVDPARFPPSVQPANVTYATTDGTMHAWYFANETAAAPGQPWLNLLYSHGSGANIAVNYRLDRYRWLLSRGRVRLFVYDYPGYGQSEGTPTEDGTARAASGAVTAFKSMLNMTNDGNITYLGRSLGGAVAMRAIGDEAAGSVSTRLVLQSTFLSWGGTLAGLFPTYGWAMRAGFGTTYDSKPFAERFKKRAGACAYQSHSRADEWVVFAEAEALRKVVLPDTPGSDGCESVFYPYDTALHDDPLTAGEKQALGDWIQDARG